MVYICSSVRARVCQSPISLNEHVMPVRCYHLHPVNFELEWKKSSQNPYLALKEYAFLPCKQSLIISWYSAWKKFP